MKSNGLITRRRAIIAGLASLGGLALWKTRKISLRPTATS